MVTETFYIKRGRRYVPVREYDAMLQNALPHGSYVTVVKPGEVCKGGLLIRHTLL